MDGSNTGTEAGANKPRHSRNGGAHAGLHTGLMGCKKLMLLKCEKGVIVPDYPIGDGDDHIPSLKKR